MNRARKKSDPGEYRIRRAAGVPEPLDGREVRQLLERAEKPDPIVSAALDGSNVKLYLVNRASVLREARVTIFLQGAQPAISSEFKGPQGGFPSINGFPRGASGTSSLSEPPSHAPPRRLVPAHFPLIDTAHVTLRLCGPTDNPRDLARGIYVQLRQGVGVKIQGNGHLAMSQSGRGGLDVNPGGQHGGGVRVSQIVETDG